MQFSLPKFRTNAAPTVLPVDERTFRKRFIKVLLGQLFVFIALYIASVYVWRFSSPVYQIYIQIPVICAVLVFECWLYKRLNIAGRLVDLYPNIKTPSHPLLALLLCIPLMAAWIFFVALTKPSGRFDSRPWWLVGGVKSYGLLFSFFWLIPALLGAFLGASEYRSGYRHLKNVSYWTFNPTGYYLVYLGHMVGEMNGKRQAWKSLPATAFSSDVRQYANTADLNGTGMILLFANLVTHKVKERAPASTTAPLHGVRFADDVFYLSEVWTTKTTHLGSFSPLVVVSPGAMLEASLITVVVNFIDLNFAVRVVDILNSMASAIERKDRSNKMLAVDFKAQVRKSKIYKIRQDVQSSWLKCRYQ